VKLGCALTILALSTVARAAFADEPPSRGERPNAQTAAPGAAHQGSTREASAGHAAEPAPEDPPIADGTERPLPDYDGRGDDPVTASDVLLWVPRVALSPLYLVSELVIRRPLGWAVSAAERNDIPQKLVDLFTFGPENNIGIVPTGLVDFGFRASVGVYFYWNDFLARGNKLRARAATGGTDWWLFSVADRFAVAPEQELGVRAEYAVRPDWVFHGLGPESGATDARFKMRRAEGGLRWDAKLWRSSEVSSFVGVRDVSFDSSVGAFDDPTVAEEVARGRYPAPPGMADGYTVLVERLSLELDTRPRRSPDDLPEGSDFVSPPGTGVRLQLRAEHGSGLRTTPRVGTGAPEHHHFVRYGGTLGGFVDLTGQQRVLGLSVITDFADPLTRSSEIPFTELASLGGPRPLRGFLEGRLVGRSDAVLQLEYQYPIWVWLDGALHYSVGNVFGEHLTGFEAKLLRQSFGMGFRSIGNRDHALEMLVAFGTETFASGAEIENVRFVLGATSGF
jgi:hypothetical protein